ncbi:LIM domain only protein 3-like protein, partial [Dinothrombium tinctorium]
MVMRAKGHNYHLECFACQKCSQRFCVGDRFYLFENK